MRGTTTKKLINNRECFIYLPPTLNTNRRVLYVHDGEEFIPYFKSMVIELEQQYINSLPIIVAITSNDRLCDYTPWPAPALSDKFKDFGGNADQYLHFIENILKPCVDQLYPTLSDPEHTYLMGFSLGGLVSTYSIFNSSCFKNIISISGSFWYPNWINYISKTPISSSSLNILLIAGRNEGKNKKSIQKDAYACTQLTHDILQNKLQKSIPLLTDEGEHHDFKRERYLKALNWICQS